VEFPSLSLRASEEVLLYSFPPKESSFLFLFPKDLQRLFPSLTIFLSAGSPLPSPCTSSERERLLSSQWISFLDISFFAAVERRASRRRLFIYPRDRRSPLEVLFHVRSGMALFPSQEGLSLFLVGDGLLDFAAAGTTLFSLPLGREARVRLFSPLSREMSTSSPPFLWNDRRFPPPGTRPFRRSLEISLVSFPWIGFRGVLLFFFPLCPNSDFFFSPC